MPYATWLPDLLSEFEVDTVLEPGWDRRGSADFDPKVVVCHHTAVKGSAVKVCVEGRPGLPGPLCQIVLTRTGTAVVIAAGRANHAGEGGWAGYSGNRRALGIEAENDGREPWPAAQVEAFHRVSAACLAGIGEDPSHLCFHREWAPRRKVDPHTLDPTEFRAAVGLDLQWWHNRGDDMTPEQDQRLKECELRLKGLQQDITKIREAVAGRAGDGKRSLVGRIADKLGVSA